MCLSFFFKKKEIKYSELKTIGYEQCTEFNLIHCSYKSKNKYVHKQNINTIQITKDKIIFSNDENLKYEYIMKFYRRGGVNLVIRILGYINPNNEIVVGDVRSYINLKFTSVNNLNTFINKIYKFLVLYKNNDTYDKTIRSYENFIKVTSAA